MKKKVVASLIFIAILVPLGLFSRQISWIPEETGDALWAMLVFCIWRILLIAKPLSIIAIFSLSFSYMIELSQLLTWPWLVSFRKTLIGHLMLGQGFLWIDLIAYTIGISCIYMVFKKIEPKL